MLVFAQLIWTRVLGYYHWVQIQIFSTRYDVIVLEAHSLTTVSVQERGNTPLHVAAQAGQAMQVELLVVYGANPTTLDRLGHTSEECAR